MSLAEKKEDLLEELRAVRERLAHAEQQARDWRATAGRLAEQMQRITHAAEAIHSMTSVDEVLGVATAEAMAIIGTHQATASFTVGPDWSQAVNTALLSEKYAAWRGYDARPDGTGIYSLVCRTNRPVRMTQAELEAHPAWKGFGTEAGRHPPLRGWLAAPLAGRDGRNLGLVQLSDKADGGDFTAEDEAVLTQLAQMASVAVENALLYQQAREEIAARTRAEAAASQWAAVVQSSHVAIVGWTLDTLVVRWNPAAQRLYGYAKEEIIGKPVSLLIPPDRLDELTSILGQVRRGEAVKPFQTVRRRKDGGLIDVLLGVSPIKDAEGRLVGASGISHDITEARRLEEQYRQAQKMEAVGHLAGGVAHDFNNLLTVINGYSDLLLGRLGPEDPMRGLLAEIHKAGERAGSLTRQLLAFSRRQVLEPKVLDLNAVVSDTEKMLRRLIGEDVLLAVVLDPVLGRVKVDPGQMQQVLLNLAVNARDAMPQGGRLTIETRNVTLDEDYARTHPDIRPGEYAMLAVSDSGVGMDGATKARLFEPFFTTKGPGKGTGLGLATVYGIVKQSGGSIEVYSEPGQGATFKVYLPRVQEPVSSGKSFYGLRTMPRGSETVLLVEDEDAVRALAGHVLRSCGYAVLEAADGRQAVQVAEKHRGPIDLLVSDVVMPHLGGRQLAERLVAGRPGLKVLFLSGYTDDAVVRHGVLGADYAFLQKPFTTAGLAQKVREVLDQVR